jgi:succinyl-diaminopimelate desuccinylase
LAVTRQTAAPNRANVIGRLAGTGQRPALVLCAHLDTVPPGEAAWARDPLSGDVADGRVHGRGALDTKGALAGMLLAAKSLRAAGQPLLGDLVVLATVDEESFGLGVRAFVAAGGRQGVGAVVVGEPTALDLVIAHRGALWIEIVTHGLPAHGAMPHNGLNAILPMGALLDQLSRHTFAHVPHPLLPAPTINIATIQGGVKTNMVPDLCRATVDIRTVPGQVHAELVAEVRQLADAVAQQWPGLKVDLNILNDKPALETPAESAFVVQAAAAAQHILGRPARLRAAPYFTDGSTLVGPTQTPAVVCGPGQEAVAHQVDESVEISEVAAAAEFYAELAWRYLGGA